MEIPIVGGAYTGRSSNLNSQVCQNLYLVLDKEEGKKQKALYGTPGLTRICKPANGEVRGLFNVADYAYAVVGNTAYKVNLDGTFTAQTGTLLTNSGKVWIEWNGSQLMIVDGTYGYLLSGGTVAQITDADFPTPSGLAYQDGYFIIPGKNSDQFNICALYDGTDWDALDYATAESDPDDLAATVSCRRELWLLGAKSYEVWANTGNADMPFERILGTNNQIGCIAGGSAAQGSGIIAWLDSNRSFRASKGGYEAEKISTEQIDYQIGKYNVVSDAISFFYVQEGHIFYQTTFPSERKTWVFDCTTGYWHTRASGNTDDRSRANCCAMVSGVPIVGDYANGKIYKYDLNKYSDDGEIIRAVRRAQTLSKEHKNAFHNFLEIEFEGGVGLTVNDPDIGSGTDPQAILRWSDDGGHTWSNEHWRSLGKIGEYGKRTVWHGLGVSRERIYEVSISDPVKRVILGAQLEAELGSF